MKQSNRIIHKNGPWRITFDTNPDTCNLNCVMCEEHSIHRSTPKAKNLRTMDFSIIRNVIKNASLHGLKEIIPSTMGEPLLYPRFSDILELVRDHSLKLNLTTNGTFPRMGVEEWGNIILPVASDVKISINSPKKDLNEKIMHGIDHDQQLDNLRRLLEIRDEVRLAGVNHPTVTLQLTFMESNLFDLPDLIRLARNLGIDRVKGHHLWVTWPQIKEESLRRSRESIARWNGTVRYLQDWTESHPYENGNSLQLDNFGLIPENGSGTIIPRHWVCPFLGREAWIAWDGTFNVCCCPEELRRTFGKFGNVQNTDIMGLWTGELYRNFVSGWGRYNVCEQCNMRKAE